MRAHRKRRLVRRPVRRSWHQQKIHLARLWPTAQHLPQVAAKCNPKTPGHYFAPALFTDVSPQTAVARDEIFGPIAAVLRVPDYDAALNTANDCEFGLSAGIVSAGCCQDRPFHAERRGRHDTGQSAHCRHGFSRTIYRPKRIILWRA